jgi:hypothetical protein
VHFHYVERGTVVIDSLPGDDRDFGKPSAYLDGAIFDLSIYVWGDERNLGRVDMDEYVFFVGGVDEACGLDISVYGSP